MKPIEKMNPDFILLNEYNDVIKKLVEKINELTARVNVYENDIRKLWDQQPI